MLVRHCQSNLRDFWHRLQSRLTHLEQRHLHGWAVIEREGREHRVEDSAIGNGILCRPFLVRPGRLQLRGHDPVFRWRQRREFVRYIPLEAGAGGFENEQVLDASLDRAPAPGAGYLSERPGHILLNEGMVMRLRTDRHPVPAALRQADVGLLNLWVCLQEMLAQREAEVFGLRAQLFAGES